MAITNNFKTITYYENFLVSTWLQHMFHRSVRTRFTWDTHAYAEYVYTFYISSGLEIFFSIKIPRSKYNPKLSNYRRLRVYTFLRLNDLTNGIVVYKVNIHLQPNRHEKQTHTPVLAHEFGYVLSYIIVICFDRLETLDKSISNKAERKFEQDKYSLERLKWWGLSKYRLHYKIVITPNNLDVLCSFNGRINDVELTIADANIYSNHL